MKRYSPDAAKAFLFALRECASMGHSTVQPEHLLLGLAKANQDIGKDLNSLGFPLERLRTLIKNSNQTSARATLPSYGQGLRKVLSKLPQQQIDARGVLKVLLLDPSSQCYELLSSSTDFPGFYRELSEP